MTAEGFKTKVTVFCICGHLMNDDLPNYVTCINPHCREYGKDYLVKVELTEHQAVPI